MVVVALVVVVVVLVVAVVAVVVLPGGVHLAPAPDPAVLTYAFNTPFAHEHLNPDINAHATDLAPAGFVCVYKNAILTS